MKMLATDYKNVRLEKLAPRVYTTFCETLERIKYHLIHECIQKYTTYFTATMFALERFLSNFSLSYKRSGTLTFYLFGSQNNFLNFFM